MGLKGLTVADGSKARPVNSKFAEFSPHAVNVADIKFQGDPDSLANFPQWVWYTVAAPVLWGGLDNEVLSSIQQETGLTYHRKIFDKPIFSGFDIDGNSVWNHVLWAVPQVDWVKLKSEFLSVAKVDVKRDLMVKYGLQELTIYDPLAMDKSRVLRANSPTHLIYAFGVMSNHTTVAFRIDQSIAEHPHVFSFSPEENVVNLAKKTLSGRKNLHDVASSMEEV